MKTRELKELKLTKNIIIPFPNFQQNTIISPTQMNDNFEEIEHAYNTLIDNHNGAITKVNKALSEITSSDNEAISNEQARVQAEETRVQNEEERVANEEERKTEETKRIAMYNTHLNDEIRREQKHIQMVGEFDLKKTELDAFIGEKEEEVQNAINSIPTKEELKGEKGDKGDRGEKGEQGERGLQGIQGIQGIQGLKGDKGDKGEQGERGLQGIQGLKGDKGDKGDKGEKGDKGDPGQNTIIDYIYEEVNSPNPSVSNSIEGSLEDIQILGNTVQDPDNLADIKSVGELQEDGTYKMSILSCGKNLFNPLNKNIECSIGGSQNKVTYKVEGDKIIIKSNPSVSSDWGWVEFKNIKVTPNKSYTIHPNATVIKGNVCVFVFDSNNTKLFEIPNTSKTFIPTTKHITIRLYVQTTTSYTDAEIHYKPQLEEGTQSTPYEPYQGNKCDILLPCQLEKVGDVSDRLYYDDVEKAWCIEKNIETIYTKEFANGIGSYEDKGGTYRWGLNLDTPKTFLLTNFLQTGTLSTESTQTQVMLYNHGTHREFRIAFKKSDFPNFDIQSNVVDYLSNETRFIKIVQQPTFIPLPRDTQIQLNSFFGTTHIYMESGEVEGTIKCKIPKSLGATVQSLNNKTDILSDRIEAIEGLKDSQNMKYETDKGYLVCKETKNGVIDDMKIKGKTLVNLCPKYVKGSNLWWNTTFESDSDGFVTVNANGTWVACPRLRMSSVNNLKPSTKYTLVIEIKSNTLVGTDSYCMNFSSAIGVEYAFKNYVDIPIGSVGTFVYTVNTLDSFENVNYLFRSQLYNTCTEGSIIYRWYLLEGDHTQNPPSYFEGLMSVGQDVDKIEVLSSNNLLEEDEDYKQDKKQILFYNENGELEPVTELHEWDSIEKHSDNKWYYHKRSGKVVLNGSEDWQEGLSSQFTDTHMYFACNSFDSIMKDSSLISDKFENKPTWDILSRECIDSVTSINKLRIRLAKSKLSTQDVTGFKQWLQANNVTVVYQLAEEKVYELAPLHLDSYANETLILCNSGAISPKMEFSITSHINELIKSQGDRISLLEEKMYKALKQVLAGDMYSLAELLYPEDFVSKEEPIDVPTLLI